MQSLESYSKSRLELVDKTQKIKYGDMFFNKDEEQANTIFKLMINNQQKNAHFSFYRGNSMKHKQLIDSSDIFRVIKKMPKGAVLHLHVDCAIDPDQFLEFVLNDNVYIHSETGYLIYRKNKPNDEKYEPFIQYRNKSNNLQKFDNEFKESIQLNYQELEEIHKTADKTIWDIFMDKIMKTNSIIFYKENFKEYLFRVCKGFVEEGISHLEVRALLGSILDENGDHIGYEDELNVYRTVVKDVQNIHPQFTFKIICQGLKMWDLQQIDDYLKIIIKLKKNHGDMIVGFDLVQEEDKFKSMEYLSKVLINKEEYEQEEGVELPFVLHGGESLSLSTESVFDLILLKTKRIGHGLNLSKHSYLMDLVKEQGIGIEICPFSNQILGYTEDLRLHPAITFHNYGLKVTISPDDPGFFKSRYINYDFFLCAAAMEFDLKDFKKVIMNSLECSLLSPEDKKEQILYFNKKWTLFIIDFIKVYQNYSNRKSIVGGEVFETPVKKN